MRLAWIFIQMVIRKVLPKGIRVLKLKVRPKKEETITLSIWLEGVDKCCQLQHQV